MGAQRLHDWLAALSLATGLAVGASCASSRTVAGGAATPVENPEPGVFTFPAALAADSANFEPQQGYRAVAENDWIDAARTGTLAGPDVEGTVWRLDESCDVRFSPETDVLAASESPPLPTRKLAADGCHGHTGFWQVSAGRVFWWMSLAGGWSVEYYGDFLDDSTMLLRRYPLKHAGNRSWRADADAMATGRATRVAARRVTRSTYEVTAKLNAVGEPDWAVRPGAGRAPSVGGTRWQMGNGCIITFSSSVLAAASRTQRLTRALTSDDCDGLRGSWQQQGKRVFWRLNLDSLTAVEMYAEVADTLMRARHFDLTRASAAEPFRGTWDPTLSETLVRVRR